MPNWRYTGFGNPLEKTMSRTKPPVTRISLSKSAALTRVLDLVPKGYTRYVSGRCPANKIKTLAMKFHERYGIGCTPAQRITRKKHGLANAILVLFVPTQMPTMTHGETAALLPSTPEIMTEDQPAPSFPGVFSGDIPGADVDWLLLVSPGHGEVVIQERLHSVLESPKLVWLGYELVRYAQRGSTHWTWRRTKAEMADWYALLGEQLADHHVAAVSQTLEMISRQPGFSGVRKQSWELIQFARRRGYKGDVPFLYHLQKIPPGPQIRIE